MLIPGIRKNYPKIKKGGKPLFLHGKDRGLQDFRRMFHVKHSGRSKVLSEAEPRIFLLGIFGKNDIIKYMFQEIFRIV